MKKIRHSLFLILLLCIQPLMSDYNVVTSINQTTGDSVSAWETFNGSGNTIMASAQIAGTFGTSQAIANINTFPFAPQTAANNSNQFAVVWIGKDPITTVQSLYGSFYNSTFGTWTTSIISNPLLEYVIGNHKIYIANNGAIIVTWTSVETATGINKVRGIFSAVFGTWTTPITIN